MINHLLIGESRGIYDHESSVFGGTTGSMPDTKENREHFHKPSSQKGQAGFPLVRIMALLAFSVRLVVKIAYAPYSGKGTRELVSW